MVIFLHEWHVNEPSSWQLLDVEAHLYDEGCANLTRLLVIDSKKFSDSNGGSSRSQGGRMPWEGRSCQGLFSKPSSLAPYGFLDCQQGHFGHFGTLEFKPCP